MTKPKDQLWRLAAVIDVEVSHGISYSCCPKRRFQPGAVVR